MRWSCCCCGWLGWDEYRGNGLRRMNYKWHENSMMISQPCLCIMDLAMAARNKGRRQSTEPRRNHCFSQYRFLQDDRAKVKAHLARTMSAKLGIPHQPCTRWTQLTTASMIWSLQSHFSHHPKDNATTFQSKLTFYFGSFNRRPFNLRLGLMDDPILQSFAKWRWTRMTDSILTFSLLFFITFLLLLFLDVLLHWDE